MDPFGFHCLVYGLRATRFAPVIEKKSRQSDEFLDFRFAERCDLQKP
jgi:hypothetical protein